VVLIAFFILFLRLWYLQILRGSQYRALSENNRLQTIYVPPPRGIIFDRNGEVLAKNRPAFSIELTIEDSPHPRETVLRLATLLGVPSEPLLARLDGSVRRRKFEPRVILRDVDRDVVAKVSAHRFELPGINVNVTPTRNYVRGTTGAHVIGYIREITDRQLEQPKYGDYRRGDLVGQFGLEAQWEEMLRGTRGVQRLIVNALGVRIGEHSYEPEQAGHNVTLTLDADLQTAADSALSDIAGAIVALDPRSGEVLALSSAPTFDPNLFAGELSDEVARDLMAGPARRLFNRALQGEYHPGSVFKIMMAVAAIDQGVIGYHNHINCPGFLPFGGRNFRCHKHSGHGPVDLRESMVVSCDVYFYTIGQRLGVDRIHEYATRFGLGERTGIELSGERPGLIPSTRWKRTRYRDPANQRWHPGETLSVAIGQGAVTTTPLQMARAVAAVVNGGRVLKPTLVRRIWSPDGGYDDDQFHPEVQGNLEVSPELLNTVRDDLVGVVNDPQGTGKRARLENFPEVLVGGKTGTAQVVALEKGKEGGKFKDHAWFVGFAPAENPEIVVSALIENGGGGGSVAAPVVAKVLDAYFRKRAGKEGLVPFQ
jgi:penicillin-binding protein 2